jgi:S1-C subfamily serine protease
MRATALICLAVAAVLAGCRAAAPHAHPPYPTTPEQAIAVDDRSRLKSLEEAASKLIATGEFTPMPTLIGQLARSSCALDLPTPAAQPLTPAEVYARRCDTVLVVAGVFKCKKCARWHVAAAGGFVLTASGAAVTNYHVVNNRTRHTLVAMTHDGAVRPVREVLAASEADDVAIVQLEAPGARFHPAPLSSDAPVGTPVCVISHPSNRLYTLTTGAVSRYFRSRKKDATVTIMSITADFARGSSGCPVFDPRGNAAGLVASTQSIYYTVEKGKKSNLQMVFKNCVPARSILALIAE